MSQLGELANNLVSTEFDYLTGSDLTAASSRASGWMEANLGKLNTLIQTSYSGVDPDLKLEEQAIYKQLYLHNYWTYQANMAIKGVSSATIEWLSLREGDSAIERVNKSEVAKTYRGMATDAKEELDDLVFRYLQYKSDPMQVDVEVYPSGAI